MSYCRITKSRRVVCSDKLSFIDTTNPYNVYQERVVLAMVGLPARGKSFISKAIVRYMRFLGCPTKIFNAGNLRREMGMSGIDASFFDPDNEEAKQSRENMAMACLDALLEWTERPEGGCSIGILDATNTTIERRRKVIERVALEYEKDPNVRLLFLESITDDKDLLETNYRMKLANDDYKDQNAEEALRDFKVRVVQYESQYQRIGDEEGDDIRYLKVVDAGRKLISQNIEGFVLRNVQTLVGSLHLKKRRIWITLVGEVENDELTILGGDSELTEAGRIYAKAIADLIQKRLPEETTKLPIITGTYRRYVEMTEIICDELHNQDTQQFEILTLAACNDLCEGLMDSLTLEERSQQFPQDCVTREHDKLRYRYPGVGGESYEDLVARCNDVVCRLEQVQTDLLLICDRAVFRTMMGYFFYFTCLN